MTLKWFAKKSKYKKVCNRKVDISFIKDYKQSHNKFLLKIPSRIVFRRKHILLGTYRKRQSFNESRTIRAVESSRKLVFNEIEGFFEQKERIINSSLLTEIINRKKSYSHIFNNDDLAKIYRETENIILHELFGRFNSLIVWQLKKVNIDGRVSNIFNQIQEYQNTKKRTVLITSYMEALSRRTLSDSIESMIENSIISNLSCNIDISALILEKLDINSGLETIELTDQLSDRIKGALYSIKIGLVQEIYNQIANVFYETHDILINSKIELKINLLEEEIAREEIYETNLLEA